MFHASIVAALVLTRSPSVTDSAQPAPVEIVLQPVTAAAPAPPSPAAPSAPSAAAAPDAPEAPAGPPAAELSARPSDAAPAAVAAAPAGPEAPAGPAGELPPPAPAAPLAPRPTRRAAGDLAQRRPPRSDPARHVRAQEEATSAGAETAARAPSSAPVVAPPSPAPSPVAPRWRDLLAAWIAAKKTYPEDARERGEEGTTVVRFTLRRDGRVLEVSVLRGSGYPALDAATTAMLAGADVPPLPPEMPQERQTVTVPLRYSLTR